MGERMKQKNLSKIVIGIAVIFMGCASSAGDVYYDKELPPEKTAVIVLLGWGSWGRSFTMKTYNGTPIAAGNRFVLPLGKAKFTADADDIATSSTGRITTTSGARVSDVEFEITLTESGNLPARTGKYYVLIFEHPADGPWGVGVYLFDSAEGGASIGMPEDKRVAFAPFIKDGKNVYTP
jgi:hypothetical protein